MKKKNILISEQQLADLMTSLLGGMISPTMGDSIKNKKNDTPSKSSGSSDVSTDFDEMVKKVIDNLEGGYYHPDMLKDGRIKDGRYGKSGETMFGIDRKAGGDINTTPAGNEFWSIIDDVDARYNWKWNYMGGPLESKLKSIVPKMIKPLFDKNSNIYLTPESREIVNSNPGLLFNFIYATWNGSGWFKKFATEINKKVEYGITDPEELLKAAIDIRKNSGNSLVSGGASKIERITNTLA
jgi:hypothetical protein